MARQGYYISTPELTRPHLSAAEWDFWYGGRPVAKNLPGPDGTADMIHRGKNPRRRRLPDKNEPHRGVEYRHG
ncbi:hypothetical protein HORIV_67460 [Vreelandella olivaria]|uniref:Uncharacterized protein n=1 Tax=Vreelandella olivaria TaxID=390919 RepID=A0ABM7GRM6_9GAMM|nr:hypothetical protein HORIV_67460 [Halomonas olivaria]